MGNRKHMRTEKKTAVKNSFGRLLATGIFVLIQVAWLAYLLLYFYRDYAWISLLSPFVAGGFKGRPNRSCFSPRVGW